jgi:hypothetical protein
MSYETRKKIRNQIRNNSVLNVSDELAVTDDNQKAALEQLVQQRLDEDSPAFKGDNTRGFFNTSIDVGANIGQDISENVIGTVYDIYKSVASKAGPYGTTDPDLKRFRQTKYKPKEERENLFLETERILEEDKQQRSFFNRLVFGKSEAEALEQAKKEAFMAAGGDEVIYQLRNSAENLEFYNSWTDKLGILSAIIPPPRLGGVGDERAYEESDYTRLYKKTDPEGIGGQIVLTVGKLLAAFRIVNKAKSGVVDTKAYKNLTESIGKTKAAKVKKSIEAGNHGKLLKYGSKTTNYLGKTAVGGIVMGEIAFDPREQNFSDLLAALPEEYQNSFIKPIIELNEYLIDNPEDTNAQARLKSVASNAAANIVVGPIFTGFFAASGALLRQTPVPKLVEKGKNFIEVKRKSEEAIKKAAKDEVDRLQKEGLSLDPKDSPSSVVDEIYLPDPQYNKIDVPELNDFNINLDKIDDSSNLKSLLDEIAEGLRKDGDKFNAEGRGTKSDWKTRTERAIALLEKNPDESIIKAVDDNVLTPELALATRMLLVAAERGLTRARNIVLEAAEQRGFVNPQEEALLIQASARFTKVLSSVTGMTASAGRVLDSFRQTVGGSKLKKTEALIRINQDLVEGLAGKDKNIVDYANMLKKSEENGSIYKDVAEGFQETKMQAVLKRLTSYLYAGVLSDPATALVNFIGSGLHQSAELGSRVIAYPIGLARETSSKLFGYETKQGRVKLGQLMARGVGTMHGIVQGFVSFPRAFLKGDMLDSLKEGDYEIDRLARTSGFAPLSIETGMKTPTVMGKELDFKVPYAKLGEQTKQAFGEMGNRLSTSVDYLFDAFKQGARGNVDEAVKSGLSAIGNLGRFSIKGLDIGLGTVVSVPMRTLIGGDSMMKQIAKTAHLYEEGYVAAANKFNPEGKMINWENLSPSKLKEYYDYMKEYVTNPNAEAYDRSLAAAAIDTFTNTNVLADRIQDVIGKPGQLVHFLTRPYIPFVQTVTNLYDRALLYSPLAPAMKEFREDLFKKGGSEADLAVSRMAVGTGLFSLGYQGASGFIQEYIPEAKERDFRITGTGVTVDYPFLNTRKAAGWHEYSMYLTNPETGVRKAYTYNRLDPFAMQIALGADLYDIVSMIQHSKNETMYYDNVDVLSSAVSAVGLSMYKNVIERNPLLQGMEAFGSAFLDTQRGLEGQDLGVGARAGKAVMSPVLSIFTNALGRRIDKSGYLGWDQIENEHYTGYLRDTYNLVDNAKYAAHTNLTVFGFGEWSKEKLKIDEIPYRFNIVSGEMVLDEVVQSDNMWRQIASITKEHTIKDDGVAQELASLNWSKRRIKPAITFDGTTIPLEGNGDYLRYQKLLSDTFRERIHFLINFSKEYRLLNVQGDSLGKRALVDKMWSESLRASSEIYGHQLLQRHKQGVPYELDQWRKGKDEEIYNLTRENVNVTRNKRGGFGNE